MDGWNTRFLLGFGPFSGAMLVLGRVLSESLSFGAGYAFLCAINAWYVDFVQFQSVFWWFWESTEISRSWDPSNVDGYCTVSIFSTETSIRTNDQHLVFITHLFFHDFLTLILDLAKRRTKKLVWIGWFKAWSLVCSWSWWSKPDEMRCGKLIAEIHGMGIGVYIYICVFSALLGHTKGMIHGFV